MSYRRIKGRTSQGASEFKFLERLQITKRPNSLPIEYMTVLERAS